MVKQNNNIYIGWETTFSLGKNRLFFCTVYFFRKENSLLSNPGNQRLILVYNIKIILVIFPTTMATVI